MLSTETSRIAKSARRRSNSAFTLIELILVMALLAIVAGVAAPRMVSFFRGRTLDVEARRILALTHYGQSRAISEGVPVVLWFDTQNGAYGLEIQAGFVEEDDKALHFTVDPELNIEADLMDGAVASDFQEEVWGLPQDKAVIRFTPDGFIDEISVESVVLRHTDESEIEIRTKPNRLGYEIIKPENAKE